MRKNQAGGVARWGACLVAGLLGASGCMGNKHHRGTAPEHTLDRASETNRYGSSVSVQAKQSAPTNSVPTKAPDDTAQNRKEGEADTLTPMDQGNSDTDRRMTQQIRQAVVSGKGGQHFSFLAKNVKIITINGEVTLRGVVENDAEKTAVGAAAAHLQGVRNVHNQLTVKHPSATPASAPDSTPAQ